MPRASKGKNRQKKATAKSKLLNPRPGIAHRPNPPATTNTMPRASNRKNGQKKATAKSKLLHPGPGITHHRNPPTTIDTMLRASNRENGQKEATAKSQLLNPRPDITHRRNVLEDFYANYAGFTYLPGESVNKQFNRLCRFKGWERERDDDEQEKAYEKFRDALVQQFNSYYGTNENDLGLWQALCRRIGIPPPETVEAARNAVLMTHVNICDIVQSYGTDKVVARFPSLDALRVYTKEENLYFPRENAYAGGLLKYLLREIDGSYGGSRKPRTGKGGRRGGHRGPVRRN